MNWKAFVVIVAMAIILSATITAFAHGAHIDYTIQTTVEILAAYDSGKPMAEAQVTVYAPDEPDIPWRTGMTDRNGRYSFTPKSTPGTWDVQVRQSGHGDIVHIPIGENVAVSGGTGYSTPQILLMGASIIWGLIGTGLYFSRKRVPRQGMGTG